MQEGHHQYRVATGKIKINASQFTKYISISENPLKSSNTLDSEIISSDRILKKWLVEFNLKIFFFLCTVLMTAGSKKCEPGMDKGARQIW